MVLSIAPFAPSPPEVVQRMLEVAKVKKGEMVYDLGCGDGRIVLAAAREFQAYGVGVEIREDLVKQAFSEVRRLRVQDRVEIIRGDLMEVDISKADVVTLYLTTSANSRIRPKLERELKSGSRVVSHNYEIPGWAPSEIVNLLGMTIYLYIPKRDVPT